MQPGRILALLIVASLIGISVSARVIRPATANRADVEAALDSSENGDVILLPPGQFYWTSNILRTVKSVQVFGAGTNDVGGTVIVDENPNRNVATLFQLTYTNLGQGLFRLSNFQIRGGVTNTGNAISGFMSFTTRSKEWRFDHLRLTNCNARLFFIFACPSMDGSRGRGGLIDHNFIDQKNQNGFVYYGSLNQLGFFGDDLWTNSLADFAHSTNCGVYIEDNYFTNQTFRAVSDSFGAAVYIQRYNVVINGDMQTHELGQRYRGPRWMLNYNNYLTNYLSAGFGSYYRGGSGVVASNVHVGNWIGAAALVHYRSTENYQLWGQTDGTNTYDVNLPDIFDFGTHTGTNGSTVLEDNTKFWTPNQWAGYSIQNMASEGPNNHAGLALSNTTNRITMLPPPHPDLYLPKWTNGVAYRIYRAVSAIDSPGSGAGDLMAGPGGQSPTNTVLGGQTYPRHALEPIWVWGNSGATTVSGNGWGVLAEGKNWSNVNPGLTFLQYPHPLSISSCGITPTIASVNPSETVQFAGASGTGAYKWFEISDNNSDGTINNTSGLYTAGSIAAVTDTVRVYDTFGNYAEAQVSVGQAGPPITVDMTANPSTITVGQSSTLTWTTTGATSATLNGVGVPVNGSTNVSPSITSVFTLVASNVGGSATKQTTVTVLPAATFAASPPVIYVGQSSTLTWTSTGATSTAIDGQAVSASGSLLVSPGITTVYTFTASNASGQTTRQATVIILPAPTGAMRPNILRRPAPSQ